MPCQWNMKMSTYLRFQTSVVCPRANRPLGIFCATGVLWDDERIEKYFRDTVEETLSWFNDNLEYPHIYDQDDNCVFWFCANRQQCIARLWELVAILLEHDVAV